MLLQDDELLFETAEATSDACEGLDRALSAARLLPTSCETWSERLHARLATQDSCAAVEQVIAGHAEVSWVSQGCSVQFKWLKRQDAAAKAGGGAKAFGRLLQGRKEGKNEDGEGKESSMPAAVEDQNH